MYTASVAENAQEPVYILWAHEAVRGVWEQRKDMTGTPSLFL